MCTYLVMQSSWHTHIHTYIRTDTHVLLHVGEEDRGVGAVGEDVLHGIPLVDAELIGGEATLVVADPGQEQAAWVVVVTAGHVAGLVERLQRRPDTQRDTRTGRERVQRDGEETWRKREVTP